MRWIDAITVPGSGLGSIVDGQAHRQLMTVGHRHVGHCPQVIDRRRGIELGVRRFVTQCPDHRAHRGECIAPGADDSVERPLGRIGMLGSNKLSSLGLHDDAGHVVSNDVVELAAIARRSWWRTSCAC